MYMTFGSLDKMNYSILFDTICDLINLKFTVFLRDACRAKPVTLAGGMSSNEVP